MKKLLAIMMSYVMVMILNVSTVFAEAVEAVDATAVVPIDTGDTTFILLSAALVMLSLIHI